MTIPDPDYTNPWDILLGSGTVDYLLLEPMDGDNKGTFKWIDDEAKARSNAEDLYPETEGMEIDGNELYIISKCLQGFFRLNLDDSAYFFEFTDFDGQPDQSTTVVQEDGSKLTYFTEEATPVRGFFGKQVGIHTRNEAGEYVNIIHGYDRSSGTCPVMVGTAITEYLFCVFRL